jgi:hypothetical protein
MEIVAGTEGSFTVADPASKVRRARMNQFQPIGLEWSWYAEYRMVAPPRPTTALT